VTEKQLFNAISHKVESPTLESEKWGWIALSN